MVGTRRVAVIDYDEQLEWLNSLIDEARVDATVRLQHGWPYMMWVGRKRADRVAALGVPSRRTQWTDANFAEALVGERELWKGVLEGAAALPVVPSGRRSLELGLWPGVADQLDAFSGVRGRRWRNRERVRWSVEGATLARVIERVWGADQPRHPAAVRALAAWRANASK